MFKLSVITDEIDQDFGHALDVAADLGMDSVELRAMWNQNLVHLGQDDVQRVKRMLRERDLPVSCLAAPFLKCYLPEREHSGETGDQFHDQTETYEGHMDILARCIELAQELETSIVRTFSFWRVDEPDKVLDQIIDLMQEPLRMVERAGITLALENEHACNVGTGAETRRLLKAISSDNLGLIWDPANAFYGGEVPYPNGYALVREHPIVHVHVKDAQLSPTTGKPECVAVGTGAVDWPGQIAALGRDGYEGTLSLETHWHPPEMSREQSSRESFAGLKSILDALGH